MVSVRWLGKGSAMYAGDSFFTLSQAAQAGLVGLSATLAVLLLLAIVGTGSRLKGGRTVRTALGLGAFWAFLWLSPQAYYLYYQAVIPNLPWQVVVGTPPSPGRLLSLVAFSAEATLSAHAKGVLGWLALLASHIRPPRCLR